jgi:Xaa-Pro aminopeptidase
MSQEIIQKMREWMSDEGLDAFLVTHPQNRSYLSGWFNEDTEGAGLLLIGQHEQILMTNPLYAEAAQHEAEGWEVVVPESRQYAPAIAVQAQNRNWAKLGFESTAMSYAEYDKIRDAGSDVYTFLPFAQSCIEQLRMVKQPHELELLKRAIAITDETFAHVCQWIQPGMTEREVQWEITRTMVALGADKPAFETIVASGPNGSMPHAHASDRPIQRGELITIDMGARYKGYCADMTRTICLGEPAEARMREVYEAALHAMKTCEAGLQAGISGVAADALARNALEMDGLAQYYIHSTGHGVGLEVHEAPSLSQRAPQDLFIPAGSVVTVEPGVYIPEWSGTRVENCVLLKEGGAEILTQSPTELVIQR